MPLNLFFFQFASSRKCEQIKCGSFQDSNYRRAPFSHFLPPKKRCQKSLNSKWRFFISQILKLFCSQNVTEHENLQIRTCELSERLLKTPEQSNQYVIFTNYQLLFNLHYCLFVCLSIVITSDQIKLFGDNKISITKFWFECCKICGS